MASQPIDIHIHLDPAPPEPGLAAELTTIRQQLETLKGLFMSLVTELQAKAASANATMAAAVLTMQQLRQKADATEEALALASQAPALPPGAVVLSVEEQAALAAINMSLPDSTQALADAIEANALLQAPVTP